MQRSGRNLLLLNFLVLGGGTSIGWLYGVPERGLLVAALLALAYQLRQLLRFEEAVRSHRFGSLKYGDGIWSQLYSRFTHQRLRGKDYRKRYRQLVKEVRKSTNAMPDGGVILNQQMEILLCNKAAQALAGFRRKQDRGQRVDNILRDPAFGEYLRAEDFSHGIEIPSPLHEGSWLLCRIVPYGADQLLLLIQDVTERRKLSVMRREFVANASHELRSPLTVISGYLDTLSIDEEVPSTWRKPVEQMQAQASRMTTIVTELLELSRLEASGPASTEEIVDVCGLLSAARKSVAGRSGVPEIELDCQFRAKLCGSGAEIESVIVNLLSNAIRHTPTDGQIVLSWQVDETGATLEVTDTGVGIEPEHVPRLTERFYRVDPGRTREEGGIGLGLAIVKYVLERHDAELQIDSTPGKGSRFRCVFPPERIATEAPIPITGT